MHLGIVPHLNPRDGGLHQFTLAILDALTTLAVERSEEFILFVPSRSKSYLTNVNKVSWRQVELQPPSFEGMTFDLLRRMVGEGRLRELILDHFRRVFPRHIPDPTQVRHRPELGRWFRRHGADWIFYTAPTSLSFEAGVPYVMRVPDVQHRLQPEFPEVSAKGEWDWREYVLQNGIRHALLILVESEIGKEEIIEFYGACGAAPDRVRILPHMPPLIDDGSISETDRVRVRRVYNLPAKYVFYPALFWPHKNHARIVHAVSLLKEETGDDIHVVFCGSFTGAIQEDTFRSVMTLAKRLGVAPQIHYLGYVPEEDKSALYAEATALVMPTFFGPVNTPVVEAWAVGCPVLASDIRGVRDQVGGAGVLVKPGSVESIAEGIHRLWHGEHLRHELARRGRQRIASFTRDDFRRRLGDIIDEAGGRLSADQGGR